MSGAMKKYPDLEANGIQPDETKGCSQSGVGKIDHVDARLPEALTSLRKPSIHVTELDEDGVEAQAPK